MYHQNKCIYVKIYAVEYIYYWFSSPIVQMQTIFPEYGIHYLFAKVYYCFYVFCEMKATTSILKRKLVCHIAHGSHAAFEKITGVKFQIDTAAVDKYKSWCWNDIDSTFCNSMNCANDIFARLANEWLLNLYNNLGRKVLDLKFILHMQNDAQTYTLIIL